MLTVLIILAVTAFITAVVAAAKRCPVEVPVILLCLIVLLQMLPLK